MRETRLILIDGLPGSGKTTTARTLLAHLHRRGVPAHCLLETAEDGQDHPLNVGGPLHPAGSTNGAALFQHYTIDSYIKESLDRWRAFVTAAAPTETVQVVESYPYQNAARILLQMDAGPDRIQHYVAALEAIMQPMRPVLIYFAHADAAEALRAIAAERGPAWEAYAIDLIIGCPYARRHGLHGIDGALTLMHTYKLMMDGLRARSPLPILTLAECAGRWETCHHVIRDFLEM